MTAEPWYFDDFTTLDLETDSATAIPIAGIQGVTLTGNVNITALFTGDSTEAEAVKQSEFEVDAEIDYAKFDGDIVEQWLGGDGSSATSWQDSSDPQKFAVTFSSDSVGGDQTVNIELGMGVAEEMPLWDGSQAEWVEHNLSLTFYRLNNYEVIDNTTA